MNFIVAAWGQLSRSHRYMTLEIALRIVLFLVFVILDVLEPPKPIIQKEELWKYRYPHGTNQIEFHFLLVLIIIFGAVLFTQLANKAKKSPSDVSTAVLGLTLSVMVTGVITNVVKNCVARPRPHYLARCYGKRYYMSVSDTSKACYEEDHNNGDMQKSFPSGHTSTAFSAGIYFSMYIAGKIGTFNSRGYGNGWRLMFTMLPTLFAVWVAVSRYVDYYHHVEDILVGMILGTIIAVLTYRTYYKPLTDEDSDEPAIWKWKSKSSIRTSSNNSRNSGYGYVTLFSREETKKSLSEDSLKVLLPPTESSSTELLVRQNGSSIRAAAPIDGDLNVEVHISDINRVVRTRQDDSNDDQLQWNGGSLAFNWLASDTSLLKPRAMRLIQNEFNDAIENLPQAIQQNNLNLES